jgi:hypothetical protein
MGEKELCLFGFSVVLALKNRDKGAVFYLLREAGNLYDPETVAQALFKILKLMPDQFGLFEDDCDFYWNLAEHVVNEDNDNDEVTEEEFEMMCAKTVKDFEKKGLKLGIDYSFYERDILMTDKAFQLVNPGEL